MNIYVASSWRNVRQPLVVAALRLEGHEVYDFREPVPGETGFAWKEIDPAWQSWSASQYRDALDHPAAAHGFRRDMEALARAEAVVLVLPCGRSAHLELGWAAGQRKAATIVLLPEGPNEPELMYRMCDFLALDLVDLVRYLRTLDGVLDRERTYEAAEWSRPTHHYEAP